MTIEELRERVGAETLTKKRGVYTARKRFFYPMGKTELDFEKQILKAIPNATILCSGQIDKDFVGGAPVHQQSHWYVQFTIKEEE